MVGFGPLAPKSVVRAISLEYTLARRILAHRIVYSGSFESFTGGPPVKLPARDWGMRSCKPSPLNASCVSPAASIARSEFTMSSVVHSTFSEVCINQEYFRILGLMPYFPSSKLVNLNTRATIQIVTTLFDRLCAPFCSANYGHLPLPPVLSHAILLCDDYLKPSTNPLAKPRSSTDLYLSIIPLFTPAPNMITDRKSNRKRRGAL